MAKGLDEAYHPLALGRSFAGAMFALAVLTGAATSGCATTQSRITGLVALRGFEQELVLDRGDETLRLGGRKDVIAQLDRLVDARVRLQGAVQGDTVLVRGYELLEAPDGMVPYIGRLVVDQSGARLDEASSDTPIFLRGEELRVLKRNHGARIWITGSVVGPQTLLIAHWGVLVPADTSRPNLTR